MKFVALVDDLNKRSPMDFVVFENVVGITLSRHRPVLEFVKAKLIASGFNVTQAILNSNEYDTPQIRRRLFVVGINRTRFGDAHWAPPPVSKARFTVRDAIAGLPEPAQFSRGMTEADIPFHPNHWCMKPKSPKFTQVGGLRAGEIKGRSFKTLAWDAPSITVAYGHREVHVHPDGKRRLSVYEALRLQGFPVDFVLTGNLSSQIIQVSEAVPPPLAEAIATSIRSLLEARRLKIAA